ncbi:hypothetical protein M422DRAFT_253350, partial [Sphaerobolus stellatus SS14]
FSPVSSIVTKFPRRPFDTERINAVVQDNDDFEADKTAMSNSGRQASRRRVDWSRSQAISGSTCKSSIRLAVESSRPSRASPLTLSASSAALPHHLQQAPLCIRMLTCLAAGTMTPIFSFVLSCLFYDHIG